MPWSCPSLKGPVVVAGFRESFSSGSDGESIIFFLCCPCQILGLFSKVFVLLCVQYRHIRDYKFVLRADHCIHNHSLVILDRKIILLISEMRFVIHYTIFLLSFACQGSARCVVVAAVSILNCWTDVECGSTHHIFLPCWIVQIIAQILLKVMLFVYANKQINCLGIEKISSFCVPNLLIVTNMICKVCMEECLFILYSLNSRRWKALNCLTFLF